MSRRNVLRGAASLATIGLLDFSAPANGVKIAAEAARVMPDYQRFIQPEAEIVQQWAEGMDLVAPTILFDHEPDFNYVKDEGDWKLPENYLKGDQEGDCEDYAFAMASILEAKGKGARVVIGRLENDLHVACEYFDGDNCHVMDINEPEAAYARERFHDEYPWEPLAMFGNEADL